MVALVIIDLAVVITWFALRHRTRSARPDVAADRHPVDPDTRTAAAALVQAKKTAQAMALLQKSTGMPLRPAKDYVDAIGVEDRAHALHNESA